MTAEEYLKKTFIPNGQHNVRKSVMCKDGFFISIQGGTEGHYCQPRQNCNYYDKVELGFPSQKDDLIMHWAENPKEPMNTVYGYVPIGVVEELVQKHGGIMAVLISTYEYFKKEAK